MFNNHLRYNYQCYC